MADAVQYIDLPLGGVDTRGADELLQPPKSLQLADVVYEPGGSVRKRDGFTAYPTTAVVDGAAATIGNVLAVKAQGAELVAVDKSKIYQWIGADLRWYEAQRAVFPVSRMRATLTNYGNPLMCCDVVARGSYTVSAACSYTSASFAISRYFAVVTETSSGVAIRTDLLFSDVALDGNIKLATSGVYVGAFWHDPNTKKIRCSVLDTTNLLAGWAAAVDVVATHAANFAFDVDGSDSTGIYLAYNSATFTAAVKVTFPAGVVTLAVGPVVHTQTCDKSITIAACTNGRLVVAYCDAAAGVRARELNTATLASVAVWNADVAVTTALCITLCGYVDPVSGLDVAYLAYSTPPAGVRYSCTTYFKTLNIAAHTTTVPASASEPGVTLCHKAFVRAPTAFDGVLVGLARQDSSVEYGLALYTYLDRSFTRYPVALYAYLTGFGSTLTAGTPAGFGRAVSGVVKKSANTWTFAATNIISFDQLGTALALFDLSFEPDETHHSITVRDRILFAGSVPRYLNLDARAQVSGTGTTHGTEASALDGLVPFHAPPLPVITDGGAGGGLVAGQTYYYKQVYEYYDRDGRLHFGPSSDGVKFIPPNTKATVTTPSFQAPMPDFDTPQIGLYRTTGNASQLIYYRIATQLQTAGVYAVYTDVATDAAISVNQTLPESGGELANFPPPPSLALALWKNRIVALGSEDGKIWPSKLMIDGEWPGFHEGLAVGTDVHDGVPVFMTSDEDKLIVWWPDAIGVVYGEPANDAGQGGTLQKPILLPQRGIGLRDRRSLVRTPMGVMFASKRGIYLLDTALQLQFIGADVFGYASQSVVGAVLADAQTEVRFLLQSGTVLIYNYVEQCWHTTGLVTGDGAQQFSSACLASGVMVVSSDTGGVWREDGTAVVDPGGLYLATWTSAYVKTQGVMGRQRVHRLWLLGFWEISSQFTVQIDYDFEGTYNEQHIPAVSGVPNNRIEIPLARHECSAVSFRVTGLKRLLPARLEIEAEKGAARRAVTVG